MGKGDKKTRKGKIFMGSYGRLRPRKKNKPAIKFIPKQKVKKPITVVETAPIEEVAVMPVMAAETAMAENTVEVPAEKTAKPKKAAAKKPAVKKAPAKKAAKKK